MTAKAAAEYGQLGTNVGDMKPQWSSLIGTQVTASENHPNWQTGWTTEWYIPTLSLDRGGDFTTVKSYVQLPIIPTGQYMSSGWYEPYAGCGYELHDSQTAAIMPVNPTTVTFPPTAMSNDSTLAAAGTTAIARCAPSNSVASLATALIELYREGLPNIIGSSFWEARTRGIREGSSSLGSEHLNVQFGLLPLLSDVRAVSRGVLNFDKLYKQYVRDSGKRVRRRYSFPPTINTSEVTIASNVTARKISNIDFLSWYLAGVTGRGDVIRRRETTINRWFSGAFTYHLPELEGGPLAFLDRAVNLLGLELDAETLWNVSPWSWAVDWFTNVGDVIHNVSAWSDDGLVLVYGYIMEHTIVRDIYRWTGTSTRWKPGGLYPETLVLVTESKVRRRATPFGFGLTMSGLTTRQKAIVAALGLSRA